MHGDRAAPVAIAEVELRFGAEDANQDSPAVLAPGPQREDPLERPKVGLGSGEAPLPAADDPRVFEIAGIPLSRATVRSHPNRGGTDHRAYHLKALGCMYRKLFQ